LGGVKKVRRKDSPRKEIFGKDSYGSGSGNVTLSKDVGRMKLGGEVSRRPVFLKCRKENYLLQEKSCR